MAARKKKTTGRGATSRKPREPVGQDGRKLGVRALRTRERLLDVTAALLAERGVLDLAVVEIARKAETSPGTFYHYFESVEEAALCLAERAVEEMPAVVQLIDGEWKGHEGLERARAVVRAFIDHWDRHHAVLSLRNLQAEQGDPRFQKIRRKAIAPMLNGFAVHIRAAQDAGRVSRSIHPDVAAAAVSAILERLGGHHHLLRASRDDVVETCALLVYQAVTGRRPDRAESSRP